MKYVYFFASPVTWLVGASLYEGGVGHCVRPTYNDLSKLARFSLKGVAWIGPQLRTSNDHSFIVGVP